jgi:hypothetical protein
LRTNGPLMAALVTATNMKKVVERLT